MCSFDHGDVFRRDYRWSASSSVAAAFGAAAPPATMTEIGKRAGIAYYKALTRKPFARAVIRLPRRLGRGGNAQGT